MLDRMLPLFWHYYSPCHQLSLDSNQEPPWHQTICNRQARQIWHQELSAMRGQDRQHHRPRNLHQPGKGPILAPPWVRRQCCTPSHGELAGHQQESLAVHLSFLQLYCSLPPDEE